MRRTLGGIGGAIGVVILVGGAFGYASTRRFIDRAARASGTVARLDLDRDSEGGKSFRPVIQFRLSSGDQVEFRGAVASNPSPYREGDVVAVLYEPADPSHAKIDGFWSLWFLPILCGLLGATFLTIGIALLLPPRGEPPPGEPRDLPALA